jgi:hypothetical protein
VTVGGDPPRRNGTRRQSGLRFLQKHSTVAL